MKVALSQRYQKIFRAMLTGMVSKGTNLLVSLLVVPLAVRYLGAESYGLWTTIAGSVNLFTLLDIGIANTLTNLISEAYAESDQTKAAEYFSSAFWIICAVAAGMGILTALLFAHINWALVFHVQTRALYVPTANAVIVAVVVLLISLPAGLAARVLAGYQELHLANLFTAAGNIASLIGVVIAIRMHAGLAGMVGAYAGPVIGANLLCLLWIVCVHKRWMRPSLRLWRAEHARTILRSGGQFFVIQAAGLVVMSSDNIVLSHYLSPVAVTPYNTTWRLVGYVLAIQGLPLAPMWPAIAEANARGDGAWVIAAYRRMRRMTLLVLAAACLVLLPFGQAIVRLWAGPAAVPSHTLVVLMCVWMSLCAITVYQSNLMGAVSRVQRQAISSAIAAALNLALSLWWVQTMGQTGVILGTIVSYVLCIVGVQFMEVRKILAEQRTRSLEGVHG